MTRMEGKVNTQKHGEKRTKGRVAIACTECRNQHLRCDAVVPTCSRCRNLHKTCVYMDLRRSRRRHAEVEEATHSGYRDESVVGTIREIPAARQQRRLSDGLWLPSGQSSPLPTFGASSNALRSTVFADNNLLSSRSVDGFYKFFFPGHPFVLPRAHLTRYVEKSPGFSCGLVLMITFIGSLYSHEPLSSDYRQHAEQALGSQLAPHGFNVQALMLLAVSLEWSGENERAATILDRAKTMSLEIGMHRRDFATRCGFGEEVLEECWRRTWWELYVIDALFAGIRHLPTFTFWGIDADVEIPCEEELYITRMIPRPRTLHQYDNRGFDDDDDESFSSFAYLIDATRILGTTLAAGDVANKCAYSLVKNAEANLMSWDLHLPLAKRDPIRSNGTVDEVLFKAHMVINTTSTHLHRPRSMLHYTPMELLCSKYAPPLPAEALSAEEQHRDRHTHKAINAAKNFVDLLTASSSPLTHSPFVMCMGSLAVATYLSGCEHILTGTELAHAKDRIRVFLGILKAFIRIWSQAGHWSSEIKLMARVVLELRGGTGRIDFPPIQAMTSLEDVAFINGVPEDVGVLDMDKDWENLMEDMYEKNL